MQTLSLLLMLAAINVAALIMAAKWGLLSWYQLNRPKFLPVSCNFCFFFWAALVELQVWDACLGYKGAKEVLIASLINVAYALVASVLSLKLKPQTLS